MKNLALIDTADTKEGNGNASMPWPEQVYLACAGTHVSTEDGAPLLVFRGEHGISTALVQSRQPSITFSSLNAARSYAYQPNNREDDVLAPRVLSAYLNIRNPIIENRDDPFFDLEIIEEKFGREKTLTAAQLLSEAIEDTGHWIEDYSEKYATVGDLLKADPDAVTDLYCDAFRVLDNPEIVQWFVEAGYDGAIHVGNGETLDDLEYKVFSPEQIFPAFGVSQSAMQRMVDTHGNQDALYKPAKTSTGSTDHQNPLPSHTPITFTHLDRDAGYSSLADLLDGMSDGKLLAHVRVADGSLHEFGITPSAGYFLRSTEAWQSAAEENGDGPELLFFSDTLKWAESNFLAQAHAQPDNLLEVVFVEKNASIVQSLGDGKVLTHTGETLYYEHSQIADYDSPLFRSEPAGVEAGDWFTNVDQEVVGVFPRAIVLHAAKELSLARSAKQAISQIEQRSLPSPMA